MYMVAEISTPCLRCRVGSLASPYTCVISILSCVLSLLDDAVVDAPLNRAGIPGIPAQIPLRLTLNDRVRCERLSWLLQGLTLRVLDLGGAHKGSFAVIDVHVRH